MPYGETIPVFYHSVPALACRDIEETIAYYQDVLGFTEEGRWGDPTSEAVISRDHLQLILSHDPDLASRVRGQEIVLFVDEVEQVYEEHMNSGADIISDLREEPWGTREYTVRDNNGYYLRVSQSINATVF